MRTCVLCLCAAVLVGCSTEPKGLDSFPSDLKPNPRSVVVASPSAKPISTNDRPPAIFNGDVIAWEEMQPRLYEVSGGQVIEEIVLERLLRQELRLADIVIDEAAIALEEKLHSKRFRLTLLVRHNC